MHAFISLVQLTVLSIFFSKTEGKKFLVLIFYIHLSSLYAMHMPLYRNRVQSINFHLAVVVGVVLHVHVSECLNNIRLRR